MRSPLHRRVLSALVLVLTLALAGCGDDGGGAGDIDAGCVGAECNQVDCPRGTTTSLSGTVYAPNGTLPLYNAIVYVPRSPVEPFLPGAQCDQCGEALSGDPVVHTTTDTRGRFVLKNVPVAPDLPVVIKLGKWRRVVHVPTVTRCSDNPLDAELTRLPRNQREGDIPQMAMSTGGADALECLLRKIGLDDSEFTAADGAGRVHMFAGVEGSSQFAASLNGGATFTDTTTLWDSVDHLRAYDVVFLSCEGGGQHPENKPATALAAMGEYADLGGRVFMSHWHNYWITDGPAAWRETGQFDFRGDLGTVTADIDTSKPHVADLAAWLTNVGGTVPNRPTKIVLNDVQHTLESIDTNKADRWIWLASTANGAPSVQYYTFTTPLARPIEDRCGKAVYSDIHVSTGDTSSPTTRFPSGCTSSGLTAQEKVLAFMIFDIAACVGPPIP